ncbi:hypothetical protein MMAD_05960 [Mycolicibacterium madagascariense]|uniref:Uncharacterized protein n=1 Tax=Mycolicibacterium madagascariense TaxID=212765 RepID=A0A7I7XCF2_9MYCO|nr:hypothetical protein [Mycolicibacterium madagascariense]MCV7011846.1 hypothetical protein [Mycolicibacterium madagascariense]BBZ26301.1 hypothetical protein MMAD_05960 [Mycolicibacterium madagascariense]
MAIHHVKPDGRRRLARTLAMSTPPAHPVDEVYRYRFDVIAPTVAHAVQAVGGTICDRAMSGWDVAVCARDDAADAGAALAILGAAPATLTASSTPAAGRIIAVAGELLSSDSNVRDTVAAHLADRTADVLVWGEHVASSFVRDCGAVELRPSFAAQQFQRHALAALGVAFPSSSAEVCWRRVGASRRSDHVIAREGTPAMSDGRCPRTPGCTTD